MLERQTEVTEHSNFEFGLPVNYYFLFMLESIIFLYTVVHEMGGVNIFFPLSKN